MRDGARPGWDVHLPGPPGPPPGATLPEAWAAHFESAPDRPLLWEERRGWVTAGDVDRASRQVAARLAGAGLRPGDRVLMSAATSVELVEAHVAALRLGLVVVPANTAYREREIAHIVGDARPRAAVVDDPDRAAWIRRADPDVLVVGPDVDLAAGDAGGAPVLDAVRPEDPALIGYTSGTTGTPKGAVLSHGNLLASSESVRLAWRWTADDRLVLALPLFHIHGLGVGLHGTLLAGGSAVLLPRFDPDTVLDAAAAHDATLFFGVPTMYARLAGSPRLGELGRLRLCVSGSAPLPPAVFDRLADGSGQRVLERYGMTESGMNVSNPYDGERRPGTVGFPLPGVDLRLARRRRDPPPGSERVRWLLGPARRHGGRLHRRRLVQDRRHRRPRPRRLPPPRRTGPGPDHHRRPQRVPPGGGRRPPRSSGRGRGGGGRHTRRRVGRDRQRLGRARLVGGAAQEAELAGFAAERLARFKCPRRFVFVDELPRNALGKVLRHELPMRLGIPSRAAQGSPVEGRRCPATVTGEHPTSRPPGREQPLAPAGKAVGRR